ncbi:ParB/RepB/Spo0J family partition protein [Vibrio sp. 404]|uniref:Probable chromosome-partitioning protein ParB n=1 Tax=Vibrio marinisediminis TaxID=2758441 RepID=A0A7W2FTX6_9VIBR|nr:ParB/RepB/Spo0J family partition protein [Vibrio marinisediminis]MBA5764173.1 ParB/RepB/Spo0J family partition protein [Vibrio marinisediminis]
MSKRGLGKGLDALLSTSSLARERQQAVNLSQERSSNGQLTELNISSLRPGVYQPRKEMEQEALEELAASIESQGIIQPIVVRQTDIDKFEIIAGERRWRAARKAGLSHVPCLIKNVEDRQAIAMALIENIQREDLNVIEEAVALDQLQNEFSLTHQQVADVIGKSRAAVSNILRLNQLENDVKSMVASNLLDMGHARALLALEGEQQVNIAEQVAKKQMTVRQTEQLVKKCLNPAVETKTEQEDTETQQMSQELSEILGSKVTIVRTNNGKAKVTINVDEPQRLAQLIAKLQS